MLELQSVRIEIGGRPLFPPLSVQVPDGAVITVMGASGTGKSTLLAYLAGTLAPAFSGTGRVLVDGRDITTDPPDRRRVGMLFQDDLLFPHLSVGANLAFGLAAAVTGANRRRAVADALAEAELEGFEDRDPATLSGGQRTRVALMRTLLAGPRALLLDEPFGRLDASLRSRLRRFVIDHAVSRGLPVLLVTHDQDDAREVGGRVLSLDHPGFGV